MKSRTKKKNVVFSTGDESLATLGEELRQKYPELVEKMEKFRTTSDRAVEKLVDTLLDLFPVDHTLVLVTHNLAQAERVSDDMICVDQGGICEQGASRNFFGDPSHEETRQYLREQGSL